MRIKTQLIINTTAFGIALLAIAVSAIYTSVEVRRLGEQEEMARNIERGANELAYLSNDYLLYHEDQQRIRWESKFSSLSRDLSNLSPDDPEEQSLVDNMKASQRRVKAVFDDVVSRLGNAMQEQSPAFGQELIQIQWSRMAVQNQGIVFDAARLSLTLHAQSEELKQTNSMIVFALLGILGAYFLANYLIVYRRTLGSISELQAGTEVVGSGHLDHVIEVKHDDEIGDLSRAFNRMTADLKEVTASRTELERVIAERKQAEEALAAAKDLLEHQVYLLQRALIPAKPQITEGYSVGSAYIPAHTGTEIGGDFLDVFRTEDGKLGILIGDVSGKGIEAAALAAITRSTVRAFAYDSSSPGDAMSHANSLLSAHQVEYMQFVTSFLVILDPATGDIRYSSAGHPPAIISRETGSTVLLCTPNMPLGVLAGSEYEESHYSLEPGDRMVLYTDGITEARYDHALFGTEGIETVLSTYGRANPDELVAEILDAVKDWSHGKLRDDTAVLIIGRDI